MRLSDLKVLAAPSSHPIYDDVSGVDDFVIPEGFVVVERSWYCGKDMGITIYARPDAVRLLPPAAELSEDEKIVLECTKMYKSSYRREEMRKRGLTKERIDKALVSLKASGFLSENGALTSRGRNAISDGDVYF